MLDSEQFAVYAFFGAVLIFKMLVLSVVTSCVRLVKHKFALEEDSDCSPSGSVVPLDQDRDLQRLERAQKSDVEDIFSFLFLSFVFLTTHPAKFVVNLCFRGFTAVRFLHTASILFKIPQPTRLLTYLATVTINLYMTWRIILHYAI